ncbi:glycoside hydrolase family 3 N-terminal domain-containing protein [Clostridium sp. KNHs205]|uniref:beta-glucosidase n=1 Tax=Clostridium sp. KNHs205 TaxID=1449050 RepID=UPI00068BDCE7|nr:glycoside hydrolase family 3 N-terminal domain-containing protein [Clostridium sp. KNHs205]
MKIYATKESRLLLAKELAAEGIVLLKNENSLLPIKPGTPVAVFGRAQLDTLIGGSGSGASSSEDTTLILDEFKKAGLKIDLNLEEFYRSALQAEKEKAPAPEEERAKFTELLNSGMIYEIFGKYKAPAEEYSVPSELIAEIPSSNTAVLILGRGSGGEECDRRIDEDYYLTASEKELLHKVASHFNQVALVLNINGFIDLSLLQSYSSINSILFLGTAGEQGAAALAEVVTGKVTPSGKLPSTMAYSYEAYPSAELFFTDKDRAETILTYEDFGLSAIDNHSTGFTKSPVALYKEGIYVGYRYFDTFNIPVMYPFGHGLSYADFLIENSYVSQEGNNLLVNAKVTNQSEKYSGKEVLQLYVSAPALLLEKPYQELLAYVKTAELKPKESRNFTLSFSLKELANYDEASAAYIIEKGSYFLRLGNSSRNTHIIGKIQVTETIVTEHITNRLGLAPVNKDKLTFLSNKDATPYSYEGETDEKEKAPCLLTLNQTIFDSNIAAFPEKNGSNTNKSSFSTASTASIAGTSLTSLENFSSDISALENSSSTEGASFIKDGKKFPALKDVSDGLLSLEAFVSLLSAEELAVLLNGYGPGLPFGGMGGKYSSTIQYKDGSDIAVSTHPTGFPGYISPALEKYGIPSVFYKDGPAGVQMTAWPTGISMACTFNNELLQEFGAACATEALELQVDSWLAPGINLQRNPIGGRNFEYYSEDPRHTGFCGLYITLGAEEAGVTTCPKHFALNEQETYRRGSTKNSFDALDSIVEERAARELYLKPFEIVVKNSKVSTIMTSFNKINGVFAAGNKELCEGILREEWGYEGIVVTDWGDMDIVVDGADAIAAGNDIIMPGGPPVISQVLKGYKEGRVTLADLRISAVRFLHFVMNSNSCKKYWEETNN